MNIMLKLFLLVYLLLIIMVTIFGVACTLTAIFTPRWITQKALVKKHQNNT